MFRSFITEKVKLECKKKLILNYIFCSDSYLLGLNKQFLQHDYYTDILTFPINETDAVLEAEIYISVERVNENAKMLDVTEASEMQRVMFHGVLHLLGYKDKSSAQKKQMQLMENRWLSEFEKLKHKIVPHGTIK